MHYKKSVIAAWLGGMMVMVLSTINCSKNDPVGVQSNLSINADETASVQALGKDGHLLKVLWTKHRPVIDGKQDKVWQQVPKIAIGNHIEGSLNLSPPDSPKDHSAYFQVLWDDDNFYLFVEVKDDELNLSSPNAWENDGIQIFLDGDNSKNVISDCAIAWPGAYDSNDDQLTAVFGQTPISTPAGIDVSALDFAYRQQHKGYTIEAALPFDVLLFPPNEGHRFGFEMLAIDNDLGVRQHVSIWSPDEGDCFWLDPSSWGTAVLIGRSSHDNKKKPRLVAHYPFEGNAKDKSGNRNHGNVFGATLTQDRFGHRNNAYDFDGVDDYIEANDTKDLRLSSWTLAGWIKLRDSFNQNGAILFKVQDSNGKYNFAALVNVWELPDNLRVSSQYETCDYEYDHPVVSEPVQKEVWTFFATTRDEESGEVRTYVNGQLQGTADSHEDHPDGPGGAWKEQIPCMNSDQLRIGAGNDITGQLFNGAIDDIRIYDGVLSAEEIRKLYWMTKDKDCD